MTERKKGHMWREIAPDHPVTVWMQANERRLVWLERASGLNRSTLTKYICSADLAPLNARMAVEAATGGAVKATDWPGVEKLPQATAAPLSR